MRIRILAFARARELFGLPQGDVDVRDGATVGDVRRHLEERAPRLRELGASLRLARNGTLSADDETLREGDEVALLPPVGGG